MPKCNGVVKEGAMHKNVAVKTDEKKRWRIEVLNTYVRLLNKLQDTSGWIFTYFQKHTAGLDTIFV